MQKFISVLAITFLFYSALAAQTTISGTVIDENGEAMAGANCYLDGTYDGATSDEEGHFNFETTELGHQALKVSYIGYEIATQKLNLDSLVAPIEVQMKEAFSEVKAVVITAGAFEASDEKKAAILSSLDIVTTAGASGDVYGAFQTMPGTTTNGESGRLFVRGGSSDESLTYINGTLVHQPFSASAPQTSARGRFNPFMFKGTIFSTGGFSAEYGNALSSVLLLNTNDSPIEDQLNISILTVGADFAGTKKWKNGAITAAAKYTDLNPYMALIPQSIDWQQAPRTYGGSMNLWQETSPTGVFKMYAAWDQSTLSLNRQGLAPDTLPQAIDVKNSNLFVNTAWKDLIGEKLMLTTGASFTLNNEITNQNENGIDQDIVGLHLKSVLSTHLTSKVKLRGGLEYFKDEFAKTFRNETNAIGFNLNDHKLAGFVESDIYASTSLVGRLGGRMDYDLVTGRTNASPRASLACKTGETSQISLAYGWFFQQANSNDRLFAPDLEPARADHYILNFQHVKNRRSFRSEVYLKDYRNLTKSEAGASWPSRNFNVTGEGYAYGLDLFFRDNKTIKNGDYWLSYSFLETKRNHQDYPELATPSFSSRHNLSFVYKHWISDWRSMVGMTFSYGSPRAYNDLNSSEFNAAQSPAYRSLDINWSYLYRQNIIFHAAISNVPGFKNEFGRRFATEPDPNGFYESQPIVQQAPRFFLIGCFITLTKNGNENQLDKIK